MQPFLEGEKNPKTTNKKLFDRPCKTLQSQPHPPVSILPVAPSTCAIPRLRPSLNPGRSIAIFHSNGSPLTFYVCIPPSPLISTYLSVSTFTFLIHNS